MNQNQSTPSLSFEKCRELSAALTEASMLLPMVMTGTALTDSDEYKALEQRSKALYVEAVNAAVTRSGLCPDPSR